MAYGKIIPGLEIDGTPAPYGVVNEREIRAGAGIMFVIGFFTLLSMYYFMNLELAFWVVLVFWIDFVLKVFISPGASIFGRIGALLVANQKPEYVGAVQKRFAWSIGLVISSIVLALVTRQFFFAASCSLGEASILGSCAIPMTLCAICLVFMWLETSVGFCVGCVIYSALARRGIIRSEQYAPACPGGVCHIEEQ